MASLSQRQHAFATAARHTKRVKRLRILLPVIALVLAVVFSSLSYIRSLLLHVEFGPLQMDGTSLVLQKPRLEGYDKEQRFYKVTAESAKQSITNFREVELTQIEATIAEGLATLRSAKGQLNSESEKLRLYGGVDVTSTLGYAMQLQDIDIDTKAGQMSSDQGVTATQGSNKISAERLRVTQSGGVIRFEGKVNVEITPSSAKPAERQTP